MMKCPQCGEPHDLSDCPRWKAPTGYRLLPVALAPHIKDALTRWTDFQASAWADVMQAQANIDAAAPERSETLADEVCHSTVCDDRCAFPRCMGPAPDPTASSSAAPSEEQAAFFKWWHANDYSGCGVAELAWKARAALAAAAPTGESLGVAAHDVLAERARQVSVEGWTPEHDDQHGECSMSYAAACYVLHDTPAEKSGTINEEELWQWTGWSWFAWWKPKDRRRNLVRAAALILAEIERIDRAAAKESS